MTRFRHLGEERLRELCYGILERLALPRRQRRYDPFDDNLADYMVAARSAGDWRVRAERVKDEHGGQYPSNWYEAVIASGIATPELMRLEVHRAESAEERCRATA